MDPDQMASSEASISESTGFSKQNIFGRIQQDKG